ncbi:glycoprotein-N-acetylgalactosamine 3-beta-galactosyltransferase 1-like isoform X2 [Gigantopelta aegis]|uniref:glycoprotein-N-acetylgalactosamine 3-beta-galactosyltransferase 1-like isoform X2 n=1 Tax=Gigantopelta aegis TaxID=1735272 RepID=UPI001B888A9E|nr:glycoprotein-N-acetylgalactosamine 3-beta-galactosyltransferase 1-like isoform X2 [Gigantopelta aegis]
MFDDQQIPLWFRRLVLNQGFRRFLKRLLPITLGTVIVLIILYEISSSIDSTDEVTHHQVFNYSRISWARAADVKVLVNNSVAQSLKDKIKILCLVLTVLGHQESQALAVNITWGSRCTLLLFVTSKPLADLPHIVLNIPDNKRHRTAKTVSMFEYAYQRYIDDFDWFLKADDDTFVVMENLRFLLSHIKADDSSYLGFYVQQFVRQGYMVGGAGYVVSRGALRMLGRKGLRDSSICKQDGWREDVDFGMCLENRGIRPFYTRDVFKREMFLPVKLSYLLGSNPLRKEFEEPRKRINVGPACCSQLTISFHNVSSAEMYQLEFLLYRIHVFGRHVDDAFFKDFVKPEPIMT